MSKVSDRVSLVIWLLLITFQMYAHSSFQFTLWQKFGNEIIIKLLISDPVFQLYPNVYQSRSSTWKIISNYWIVIKFLLHSSTGNFIEGVSHLLNCSFQHSLVYRYSRKFLFKSFVLLTPTHLHSTVSGGKLFFVVDSFS